MINDPGTFTMLTFPVWIIIYALTIAVRILFAGDFCSGNYSYFYRGTFLVRAVATGISFDPLTSLPWVVLLCGLSLKVLSLRFPYIA